MQSRSPGPVGCMWGSGLSVGIKWYESSGGHRGVGGVGWGGGKGPSARGAGGRGPSRSRRCSWGAGDVRVAAWALLGRGTRGRRCRCRPGCPDGGRGAGWAPSGRDEGLGRPLGAGLAAPRSGGRSLGVAAGAGCRVGWGDGTGSEGVAG